MEYYSLLITEINYIKKIKQSRIDSVDYITKKTEFNKYTCKNTLSKTITNAKRVYYKQMFDRCYNNAKVRSGSFIYSKKLDR